MTYKRTERAWHYHADGDWPCIEIDADGRPQAVSTAQLEHSHEGGGVPHTHRLQVVPDDPHPDGGIHDPRFKAVRDDTPIFAAAGGSGRLRPHDWQPVRSTERVEGLQWSERCAGCGAGRTTLTAADTGEHRITWVDPDSLPGGCPGPGEGHQLQGRWERLICGSCGKAIPLGSHPPPPDTADQFCVTSVVIRDYDQNANPPSHWFND